MHQVPPDQRANLAINPRTAPDMAGLPVPVGAETAPVPADHGLRLDDDDRVQSTTGRPPGRTRLVLGRESLGRVVDPGPAGGLKKGDLVVGIVRRPDPVPCPNCAVGEWDMCRNGQYTERGIKLELTRP